MAYIQDLKVILEKGKEFKLGEVNADYFKNE